MNMESENSRHADEFERDIESFELQCQCGDFIAAETTLRSTFDQSQLKELLSIHLEMRWKKTDNASGTLPTRPRLNDYVQFLPQLETPEICRDLLAEEYRVRQRWGDRPSHGQFVAEYPDFIASLPDLLSKVDAELRADSAAPERIAIPRMQLPKDDRAPLLYSDYLLHEHVGSGATGRVYRATQRSLDRTVAVKALRRSRQSDAAAVEQSVAEAKLLA